MDEYDIPQDVIDRITERVSENVLRQVREDIQKGEERATEADLAIRERVHAATSPDDVLAAFQEQHP